MRLRAGDWVEVRSKEEILATLDEKARFEELPFMPQMFSYCGQRFQVYKRAHKTCDTVNQTGGRSLVDGIHLDLRCDGEAYGGCKAACLIFWKEAWLKPVNSTLKSDDANNGDSTSNTIGSSRHHTFCTEKIVMDQTRVQNQNVDEETTYVCQATLLPLYTKLLPWWNLSQYLEDFTSKNIPLNRFLRDVITFTFYWLLRQGNHFSYRASVPFHWLYDYFQTITGGVPYPRKSGNIPLGQRTPTCDLNLKVGDIVKAKSYKEILLTLDESNKNRGLFFDAEHVPYCGGTYRVKSIVEKFIDEKTGKMITPKNKSVILEGVFCQARYSDCRLFCPRAIFSWWREIWLEKIIDDAKNKQ